MLARPLVPKHTRRWYQFSLITLIAAVTMLGLIVGWVQAELSWVHQRQQLLAKGWCGVHGNRPPGLLWLFTDDGYLKVWKFGALSQEEIQNIGSVKALFPEATLDLDVPQSNAQRAAVLRQRIRGGASRR